MTTDVLESRTGVDAKYQAFLESDDRAFSPRPSVTWVLASCLLFAGLALRLYHYLCDHTIWYDESVLLFNIFDKDAARLLGPLDYEVGAPPLFLWMLRGIAVFLGDNTYVWRAFPFLTSCGTLVLTYLLARRVLAPLGGAVFVGLVAFSDAHVWLGCNVKPYSSDAFIATALLMLYVLTDRLTLARRMLLLTAAAPVALGYSYPAQFVYGALLLALLLPLRRGLNTRTLAAYALLAATVLGIFALLYVGPIRAQRVTGLVAGWNNKFPDLGRPLTVPGWLFANTALVFHYCYNPIGVLGMIFFGAGIVWCKRQGRLDWALAAGGPLLVCIGACIAKAYPIGNNRLMLFAAPGIGFLIALGVEPLFGLLHTRFPRRRVLTLQALMLAILLVPEAVYSATHIARPWNRPDSKGLTRFVNATRLPTDIIASDEGNYHYFYRHELRKLIDVGQASLPSGQRVWVLWDEYNPVEFPSYIHRYMLAKDWEMLELTRKHRCYAALFVKR